MLFWIFAVLPFSVLASFSEDIIGSWQATGYYYEDQLVEPSDPQLTLIFDFFADGTHRLYWQQKGETAFCERRGAWYVSGDQLFLEATWINPENGSFCSADPDMKLGVQTQSTISFESSNLHIQMPFSDTYIIYVWEPVFTDNDIQKQQAEAGYLKF